MANNRIKFARQDACPIPATPYVDTRKDIGAKFVNMDSLVITRPLATRILNIGTTRQLIIQPPHVYAYLVKNPSLIVGLTSSYNLVDGTVNASGNTQSSPLGVANYLQLHWFLNVTSVTGSWEIIQQVKDPYSGTWIDAQSLFTVSAVGSQYAFTESFGLATDLAVAWNMAAAGSMTFTLTVTLKDAIRGTSTGVSRTIYIGGRNVTSDTGYPLHEGDEKVVFLGKDVELWAVADVDSIPIKIFML